VFGCYWKWAIYLPPHKKKKAAIKFNTRRSTLINKLKGKHVNEPGQPPTFSPEEETTFVRRIVTYLVTIDGV
jgi:hypothetical protein